MNQPTVAERNAAEFLGQLVSLRVAESAKSETRTRTAELAAVADSLGAAFTGSSSEAVAMVLRSRHHDVLRLAAATGAVVEFGGQVLELGVTPPRAVVEALRNHWRPAGRRGFWTVSVAELTDDLGPDLREHLDTACGVLAVPLTDDWRDVAMWFRPELVRTVDWGGDPHNAKLASFEGDTVRLSPRKSFERWRETVRGRSEAWADGEVAAAESFAQHLGAVVLRREREAAAFADDLQRTMLPDRLPLIDGYLLDASYVPAAGRVGGDWYDALAVGDGTVAALIGDIAGHGLGAAAEMAQLRNVLRGYLLDASSPGAALDQLNHFMMRVMPRSMATVACVLLDTASGDLTVAHAGHLPGLHVSAAGSNYLDLVGNTLLGTRSSPRRDTRTHLAAGDSLVLYSDGLIERRGETLDQGLDRLRSAGADLGRSPVEPGTARCLADRLAGPDHDDDVTVLVIHRCP